MKKILDNNWIISVASGVLLGLSFPPIDLPLLSFPAFMLLFHLLHKTDGYKELAYVSYPAFVIWNLIVTYWLMMADLAAGIAAVLANAVLMTIPLCLMKLVDQTVRNRFLAAFLHAGIWVSYEYLHYQWELSWPWLSLANAWANFPFLIKYISVTGSLGITFWVVFASALLFYAIRDRQRTIQYGAAGALLLFPAISLFIPSHDTGSGEAIETVVVQPNFNSYVQYGGYESLDETMSILLNLSDSVRSKTTALVVWPENSIDDYIQINSSYAGRVSDSAATWQTNFLVGSGLAQFYEPGQEPLIHRTSSSGRAYNFFNAALYFGDDGNRNVYHKHNLVPIVERVPYANFLSRLDVFEWVDWNRITGFGKGEDPTLFGAGAMQTPGLVCYDSVFPSWVGEVVKNGATFLTIITNDGWWGDTFGHHQHFAYARLRALEFDRWIVRSANNGISGIIAPDGSVKVKTKYWIRTAFSYSIIPKTNLTFYARFGDLFAQIMLIISSGTLLYLIFRVKFPRK